jgi:Uma2 family endonuclease
MQAHTEQLREDQIVGICLDWKAFRQFLKLRGEAATHRLVYLEPHLELLAPSASHELIKGYIGRLLESWADECGVDLISTGEATLQSRRGRAAVEPDESYCVGTEASEVPDLAIEVVWTNAMLDRLEAYARLGVREVWVWETGRLRINVLRGKRYTVVKQSRVFPTLDVTLFEQFVRKCPSPRALRDYRAAVRAH